MIIGGTYTLRNGWTAIVIRPWSYPLRNGDRVRGFELMIVETSRTIIVDEYGSYRFQEDNPDPYDVMDVDAAGNNK